MLVFFHSLHVLCWLLCLILFLRVQKWCLFIFLDCLLVPGWVLYDVHSYLQLPGFNCSSFLTFLIPSVPTQGISRKQLSSLLPETETKDLPRSYWVLGLGHLAFLLGTEQPCWGCLPSASPSSRGFSPLAAWFPGCCPCRGLTGMGPALLLSCLPQAGPIHFPEHSPQKLPSKRLLLQRKATVVLGGGGWRECSK